MQRQIYPPGTAAGVAGLKGIVQTRKGEIIPGDIITAIEGKPVDSVGKLIALLDDYKVGEKIMLGVIRQEKIREVQVILQPGD